MSVQLTLFVYGALMLSLGLFVRWECSRRRKGPIFRPGALDQLGPRLAYTPPPDRRKRAFDGVRR